MSDRSRFPPHNDARYFSIDGYRSILERATGLGYRCIAFREFDEAASEPFVLLRHDLDHTLQQVEEFAHIEAEAGAHATYFVQVACDYYNLLSRGGRALLATLKGLGHEVGLHYDAARYAGNNGHQQLNADLRLLENLADQTITSAAQHLPIDGDPVNVLESVSNDAYEPRFTAAPMTYISDSLMVWRDKTPHDLLDAGVSFQFLTHPETWMGSYAAMDDALMTIKQQEIAALEKRYDDLVPYYAELLEQRAQRDREFRRKRGLAD